ncbi:hypothetical protein M407DRAFT_105489 [Tulasnella calospora MUT 4182]|uniref:DH domain-containing protein n=1 Tax=Tulasnella calospora MUT 4182 TaxID=1051891 RepID=A0A0C3QVB8_9AGAM|nr:hypothetical protein M407DRAFT_105489 [Tulasnella calospora MUT 4182]
MKAFLHRLRSKEKDSRESRLDKEKPLEARPYEKPSPTLLPVIPPPFKQGDDFFADPALLSDRTSGPQQGNAITRALSAHNRTNNSNHPSNITSNSSRPQSQLDISMQKPLPPISPVALSMIRDEPSSGNRRSQEGNRSSNLSSSPVTPRVGGSRSRGDPDSQGRSTLSKQSQSTSSHLNSMTTDDTSITGGSSAGATQTQNPTSPAAGATGPKKVAFISPPPTPGGLSISTALPDMVADLNSDNGGGSNPTSPPAHHQHTNSVSKSITGSTKDASALDTSTDSTASLALKSAAPVTTTPSGRSSTTNLASKASTSKSSPSSASTPRGVTSPFGARAVGTPVPQSAPARSQSRTDFAQSTVSFRSGTPYSYLSGKSTTIQPPSSWSEAAEEDLVSNLGPRERTRQEVLWEIVTSEQRYVSDLIKLKETFIDPLLHPYATSAPPFASDDPFFRAASPTESIEHLPIASRFLASPTPGQKPPGENVAGIGTVGYSRQRTASEGPRSASRQQQDDAQSIGSADDDGDDKLGRLGSSVPYLGGLKGAFKDRVRLGSGNSGKSPPMTGANSPYGKSGGSKSKLSGSARSSAAPVPSRSHQSLPPPSRNPGVPGATGSRQSLLEGSETIREGAATSMSVRTSDTKKWASSTTVGNTASRMFGNRKLSKVPPILEGSSSLLVSEGIEGLAIPTHLLPPDLRICLEVLEESLKGHMTLFEGLRKRYDEQYPLVRSLADVFVANSHILKGYATYVLHLERALEQVDNALLTPETSKKPKNQGAADWAKVCRLFKRLEEIASDKGETGLAISLSKPFQRLLKYPLMFQNLLFHTDPSTFEYEATLEMVGEVERIVRSIEDEKIQKEERDKTRDIFARIEGLEKVKLLAVPKPSRMLIEEKQIIGVEPSIPEAGGKGLMTMSQISASSASGKNVRTKSSFKRLSDVLGQTGGKNGVGGKNDLWLVRFNDVVLRCQRTGTTSLPLATGPSSGSRTSSMPDLGAGKAKYATTGRRASQLKPRNLYKFLKIETWVIGNAPKSRPGMVSMEDISRSRSSGIVAIEPVKSGETDDEDGNDSDDSDRKSKMSFSYWGADKITVDPVAAAKAQARAAAQRASSTTGKRSSLAPTAYLRPEPAAKAKFGHRLRNSEADEDLPNSLRSSARRGVSTSSASGSRRVAAASIDDTTTSVGSRKPAWNSKTSSPSAPGGVRRVREQSITSTSSAAAARLKAASPAPTEDSGVVWIDPSVNRF